MMHQPRLAVKQEVSQIEIDDFHLQFDQSRSFGRLQIQFQEVVEDSRCPVDVDCVWAGRVTVAIGVWEGKTYLGTYQLTLGEDPDPDDSTESADAVVGDYYIRLKKVFPELVYISKPLEPADYSITLQISKGPPTTCDD